MLLVVLLVVLLDGVGSGVGSGVHGGQGGEPRCMQARGLRRDPHTKRDLLSATNNKIASGFRLPSRPCLPSRLLRVSTAVGAAVGAALGAQVGAGAGAGWWAGWWALW